MNEMITVKEVMEILKVSNAKAYLEMRKINAQMEREGFLTIRGRVNKYYLLKKFGLAGASNVSNEG